MLQEAYVSYEVAKLLKEKGFNDNYPKGDCTQIACTQQMAMAWLRKKQVYIMIDKDFSTVDGWHYFITTKVIWESEDYSKGIADSGGWTYEEETTYRNTWCDPLFDLATKQHSREEELMILAKAHHDSIVFLLENHFDFLGLIQLGLAIEVTAENNPYKE